MRLHGRIETLPIEGKLLQGNPLGDPAQRELHVYLPPGYDDGGRFPTVMVLAGYGSTGHSLLNYDFFSPNLVERFDKLVAQGDSQPALLVMPDAINKWGGSQFLDSAATGNYQSYLADEVVAAVDANFRTIAERAGRAVVGKSSGGFGALRLGLDRPEVFAAVGSHAGDSAFEVSILPELTAAAIAYDRAGGLEEFVKRFDQDPRRFSFTGLMILAYAAAYAPLADGPLPRAELPMDIRTGSLLPEVWSRWCEHDPLKRIENDPSALTDLSLVYLDAGDRDEHGLHFGSRRMAEILAGRDVNLVHEEFEGGHRGTGYRYDTSLPLLIKACSPNTT